MDRIAKLCNYMEEYHKRPLTYKSVVRRPFSGRSARSKHSSEHVGVKAVGRRVKLFFCFAVNSDGLSVSFSV